MNQENVRYKQQLELSQNEKQNLEKNRLSLLAQNDDHQSQIEKLKSEIVALHHQKDSMEDEKVTWCFCVGGG